MSKCIFKKFKQINCGSLFPQSPLGHCTRRMSLLHRVPWHMCLWSESQAEMPVSTFLSAAQFLVIFYPRIIFPKYDG